MVKRLLIIEDDEDMVYTYRKIWESPEFSDKIEIVSTAANLTKGFIEFVKHLPDVVILDILFHRENGKQIINGL